MTLGNSTENKITTTLTLIDLNRVIIEEKSEDNSSATVAATTSLLDVTEVPRDPAPQNGQGLADVPSHQNASTPKKDFFDDMVIEERPEVVQSITYKLKSHFVNHSIYITLGYIEMPDGRKRPLEIFINSKDLTKTAEFALLGRLLSAIFRRTPNPVFILEELNSLFDPNGGYLSNGRFYASIYAEIAEIIERFFKDIQLLSDSSVKAFSSIQSLKSNGTLLSSSHSSRTSRGKNREKLPSTTDVKGLKESPTLEVTTSHDAALDASSSLNVTESSHQTNPYRICPACDYKTLKFDNGCYICLTCGYSKCE